MRSRSLLLTLGFLAAGCGAPNDPPDDTPTHPPDPPPDGLARIHVVNANAVVPEDVGIYRFDDMKGKSSIKYDDLPRFQHPCGIALDDERRIYFGNGTEIVRMDNMYGDELASFGGPGTGVGQFGSVAGLALDAEGRIYVVDSALNRVVRVDDMTGAGWVTFGEPGAGVGQFDHPSGIAVSPEGTILIGDRSNHRVVEMDDMNGNGFRQWTLPKVFTGGDPPITEGYPYGVAYDRAGRIYAADFQGWNLYRIDDITGNGLKAFTRPEFIQLSHVFVDENDRIFMTMLNGSNLVAAMDDMDGTGFVALSGPGEGQEFHNPCGIAVR